MEISQRVQLLLKEHGCNGNQLEELLPLSNGVVSKWNTGKQRPSIDAIIKMASFFGVTTDYLLTGKDAAADCILTEDEMSIIEEYRVLRREGVPSLTLLSPEALEFAALWQSLDDDGKYMTRATAITEQRRMIADKTERSVKKGAAV